MAGLVSTSLRGHIREGLHHNLTQGNAPAVLSAVWYLLKDEEAHKKRAYLATYLLPVDTPPEYSQDESRSAAGFGSLSYLLHVDHQAILTRLKMYASN